MAEEKITLRVITPEKIVLDTTAAVVRLPGADGALGVLPRHAPMVAALGAGTMSYVHGETEFTHRDIGNELFVAGGFAEVRDNTVRVVTESSERAEDIDVERARKAEERARKRLQERIPDLDVHRAEASLQRALLRLRLAGRLG